MAADDNLVAIRDMPVRVGIVAIDDCLTVAVGGLLDVFAVANRWHRIRTPQGKRLFEPSIRSDRTVVNSFTGYPIPIDGSLKSWEGDVLICSAVAHDPVRTMEQNSDLADSLGVIATRRGVTVASVCTGAFFLAEAGLLQNRRATTNPMYARSFSARYPSVELCLSRVLVDEGPVITAGTVSAGLNLALHLVEKHGGVEIASLTAKALAIDKNRVSQAPYLIPSYRLEEGDALTVRTQRWLEAHHSDAGVDLEGAAQALGASSRTLQRHFTGVTGIGPMHYLRLVRLEAAKRLLETTDESIEAVAWKVGYSEVGTFHRMFKAQVELTPAAYRSKFGK